MNGLLFFEDGTVVPFGTISSVTKIVQAANNLFPDLIAQERSNLLKSISKEELKQIVQRLSEDKSSDDG